MKASYEKALFKVKQRQIIYNDFLRTNNIEPTRENRRAVMRYIDRRYSSLIITEQDRRSIKWKQDQDSLTVANR